MNFFDKFSIICNFVVALANEYTIAAKLSNFILFNAAVQSDCGWRVRTGPMGI